MGRTAAQALIEEGKEIGIEIGAEQGALRTRREVLLKFMKSRFGYISSAVEQKIGAIQDMDKLSTLIERVARANNISDSGIPDFRSLRDFGSLNRGIQQE